MNTANTLASACCLAVAFSSQAQGQITSFADDFEAPALDPFWTRYEHSGFVTFPSSAQVHGGGQALQLNTTNTGVNKEVGVGHLFPQPTYGRISVWVFDTGAGITSSNYIGLIASPFDVSGWDYDLGINNGGAYYYGVPGGSGSSGIRRTPGWHRFEIESLPASSRILIDGTPIYSGPGGSPFTQVRLNMNAPSWRPAWVSHFDDFSFQAQGQIASFADDFEAPALDPFWTRYQHSGFVTFPSSAQVHGGGQALQLNTTNTGVNKEVGVGHLFPQPTYGRISVWVFDTGAGITSSNYIGLIASPFDVSGWDYDLGINNGGAYYYGVPGGSGSSGIRRTPGWHRFEIESLPASSRILIDGTPIYWGPGGSPFTQVRLNMNAPSWRPAWVSHFDDFSFVQAVAATYAVFGAGCAGSAGVPTFVAPTNGPRIGTTFQVTLQTLPISSAVFGILGISNTQLGGGVPLPLDLTAAGMPGCRLLVSTEWTGFVGTRPTPPTALWSMPIPNDAALLQASFFQQVLVTDPGINALGAVLSNAGQGVIGSY